MDLDFRKFISKYKIALIIIIGYFLLLLCLSYYVKSNELFEDPIYLTPLIPINDMYVQVDLILLVFVPISALIGGLVGGYLLSPILLFAHKSIFGQKYSYWIQQRPKSQTFGTILRGYFPALLTININSIILFSFPWIIDLILNQEFLERTLIYGSVYTNYYIPGFLVLLMFTISLGTLVFSPTWFLTDAGIMYSHKEKVTETNQLIEVRTVGGRFTDFLRGYAGIGVTLSYLQFLLSYMDEIGGPILSNPINLGAFLLFFFGIPIFLLITILPALIFFDLMKERRLRFIRKIAEKMGIIEFADITIAKVKRD
jgi:hypothetical protein